MASVPDYIGSVHVNFRPHKTGERIDRRNRPPFYGDFDLRGAEESDAFAPLRDSLALGQDVEEAWLGFSRMYMTLSRDIIPRGEKRRRWLSTLRDNF